MIPDRLATSLRRLRWTPVSGETLTLLLIALSIVGGIALAIACSYRPIALWWVMIGCSAVNVARFGARVSRQSRAGRVRIPGADSRLAAAVIRTLTWSRTALGRAGSAASKASLDRQHRRFLVWFTEHNLLWTMIGFGGSLLLWHRFGPTTSALAVMAALMSCALFAALGAAAGASAPTLGLCWREPCRTPDLRMLRRLVHDIGCVVVLKNRRDYAARRDWAKGGRFHELFLTVDELARAGVEPGLEAVLAADDPTARRALARKERLDRAIALTPVFAAGLLAALFVVPPLAGSEPLPSLWTIVTRTATPPSRASVESQEDSRNASNDTGRSKDQSPSQSARASNDASPRESQTGNERPDLTGSDGNSSITGDAIASGRGNDAASGGQAAGAQGEGANADGGGSGSGGSPSSGEGRSSARGGRGGGPRGYGTGGVAPQRAESPAAVPDAPVNPGKTVEVVLPAFGPARDDQPGDDPAGTKRKADATEQAQGSRARGNAAAASKESATREPVQRLPNWIFELIRK